MVSLNTPIANLPKIGPIYTKRLKKLGIENVEDLLYHLPSRYENYSLISKINTLQEGEKVTIVGKVISFENVYTKQGKQIQKVIVRDETGQIEAIWYNQPFLKNIFLPGKNISLSGKVSRFVHSLIFEVVEYEVLHKKKNFSQNSPCFIHTGRLVPIYPETAGVSSKWLRLQIYNLLFKLAPVIYEDLPSFIIRQHKLLGKREAIFRVHFPRNLKDIEEGRKRLAFDELLTLELAAYLRKKEWQKEKVSYQFKIAEFLPKISDFIKKLPFELTSDQKKAVNDILQDLANKKPMNRLLEGDVGSGKTVVAAIAMYATYLNGFQSALMAPTEILAFQHYETIKKILKPWGLKIALLTGSRKTPNSPKENTNYQIFIGTHALLSQNVWFEKLGLVIIDEQQRFGVSQRALLREKGLNPHVLTLTATPIPRTIALTLYADLDLTIIEEMPKGRLPVKTWVVPPTKREAAYRWIKQQIQNSGFQEQAFIICPLIEESETSISAKAALVEYERLKNKIFPDLRLGLLHGKMRALEKKQVMEKLKNKELDILVATPVVEVGIDIPSATIMMIEGAERFGLAQLHQLRGRVGRGEKQSYCLLFTESENEKIIEKLKLLEKISSGPKLAEYDLKLRGAGEIFGTRQHGNFGLKIADFSSLPLIEQTTKTLHTLINIDSSLSRFPLLKEKVKRYKIGKIAPD